MPKAAVVGILGIGMAIIVSMVIFYSVSKYLKKQIGPDLSNHAMTNGLDPYWEEKRERSRLTVSWQASMETPQGTIQVKLKNISHSGAFVVCPEPMALNEKVKMVIEAPNLDPFPLQAEVIWSNIHVPEDRIVHRGMGIRFVENTEEERSRLRQALQENFEEDKGV